MRKSVTLVELLIAIGLLGVIVLGAISFDVASREFLSSSEEKVTVLNELTFVLEHIHKNVLLGVGDFRRRAVGIDSSGVNPVLFIWQDLTVAGNPLNTPQDYSDDRKVEYIFDATNHLITFEINDQVSAAETISDKLISITATVDANANSVIINNFVFRRDPALAVDPHSNPEVTIENQIFFSLAQSLG
jgi:hypothetical protein